eukprot:358731-Chlamydomonas_euryale.AAC.11
MVHICSGGCGEYEGLAASLRWACCQLSMQCSKDQRLVRGAALQGRPIAEWYPGFGTKGSPHPAPDVASGATSLVPLLSGPSAVPQGFCKDACVARVHADVRAILCWCSAGRGSQKSRLHPSRTKRALARHVGMRRLRAPLNVNMLARFRIYSDLSSNVRATQHGSSCTLLWEALLLLYLF